MSEFFWVATPRPRLPATWEVTQIALKKLKETNYKTVSTAESASPQVGENVEKTITFEKRITIQKRLPKPWTTIKLKNYSTRERKAILFMKLLWEHGYRKAISHTTMDAYVEKYLGGFRTTKHAYLGHVKIKGRRGSKHAIIKKGLFEKRRWAYYNPYKQLWTLNHSIVPLPYHYKENLVPSSPSPLPNNSECVGVGGNIKKISLSRVARENDNVATLPRHGNGKEINNNNTCERENFSFLKSHAESESNLTSEERAILKASRRGSP